MTMNDSQWLCFLSQEIKYTSYPTAPHDSILIVQIVHELVMFSLSVFPSWSGRGAKIKLLMVCRICKVKGQSQSTHLHQIFFKKAPFIWSRVPETTLPRVTLAEVTFSLFLSKLQPTVYIRNANSSRGARQLGRATCLTSASRVTLASGTTFLDKNAWARLPGTALGVASVT